MADSKLFVAQIGAQEIKKELSSGEDEVFKKVSWANKGTAGKFIKMFGKMSPSGVLNLVDKSRFDTLSEKLLQHADDLDHVPSLLTLVAGRSDLNPPMNAVCDGFN